MAASEQRVGFIHRAVFDGLFAYLRWPGLRPMPRRGAIHDEHSVNGSCIGHFVPLFGCRRSLLSAAVAVLPCCTPPRRPPPECPADAYEDLAWRGAAVMITGVLWGRGVDGGRYRVADARMLGCQSGDGRS